MAILLIIGGLVLGLLLAHSDGKSYHGVPTVYVVQTRRRPSGSVLIIAFLLGFVAALILVAQQS